MEEKYNTKARQSRIRQKLLDFHLPNAMDSKSCTPNKAVEKIQDEIKTYTAQES